MKDRDEIELNDFQILEEVLRSTPQIELPDPFEEVFGG